MHKGLTKICHQFRDEDFHYFELCFSSKKDNFEINIPICDDVTFNQLNGIFINA